MVLRILKGFLIYVGQLAIYDTFKNHIKKDLHSKDLVVLINGPSLSKQSFRSGRDILKFH
jgi:hypothetical protein